MDHSVFTYASPDDPLWKRLAIGCVEVATGRNKIRDLYFQQQAQGWNAGFFATAIKALKLDLQYDAERLRALPAEGPLVVIANHPFGVLDGIVMCALMEQARSDFLVLTNAVLMRAPEMRARMLPIDFTPTREAQRANAASRAQALDHVQKGGCIVIFPGAAVSTSPDWFGREQAIDPPWTPFVARLVQQAKAPVAPIFFPGQNSALFHFVSHISQTARLALFFHEVRRRIGTEFPVKIGEVVDSAQLSGFTDRQQLTDQLRNLVYAQGDI